MISSDNEITQILDNAKTIAVIGCSPDKYRTSHYIASFLKNRGYRIIPVNPNAESILGEKCYDSVDDIPSGIQVDIFNVFRISSK